MTTLRTAPPARWHAIANTKATPPRPRGASTRRRAREIASALRHRRLRRDRADCDEEIADIRDRLRRDRDEPRRLRRACGDCDEIRKAHLGGWRPKLLRGHPRASCSGDSAGDCSGAWVRSFSEAILEPVEAACRVRAAGGGSRRPAAIFRVGRGAGKQLQVRT